ncbi:Nif3-like dinuclear metal center hexameric protein [Capillimicrobium parvum]|uniref:GTP cyclohydrolase 1 type 2 homolog n=1 Tax=Capillimicrobium parvum TaxID=2884022 RepID=A0A9E6Y1H3_9ACTN|nr:Nif3-like dinuclear metal center hexameric protein [Capillimicrobium parvum]UGS38200.1 GTP cyclohydrolase 1 type 2 [Capillimicrobium parvum]
MTPLADLLSHLDALLRPNTFADYGPNGLQVPGRDEIDHVVTGVSASVALFERAAELGAGLVLVHHGLFWGSGPARPIDAALKARLKPLFDHDIALAAYHLPLDAHPQVGNNALLATGLGGSVDRSFAAHGGEPVGFVARFDPPIGRDELVERIRTLTAREPLVFPAGPDPVTTLGIVSGGAADDVVEAIDLGLDAFLTGEPAERVMAIAQEGGVTFVAAGHYATETFGIRAVGELLAERFGVRHTFVDIPNPI